MARRYRLISPCVLPRRTPATGVVVDSLETRTLLSGAHHFHTGTRHTVIPSAHTGTIVLKRAAAWKKNGKASPNNSTSPVGRTPIQIRHAYGFDQVNFNGVTGDGTGQTIAIVDAYYDPNITSDLQAFDAQFGLPDPSLSIIDQRGITISTSHHPLVEPAGTNWALETALDVEWVHAIAPKASLVLVECASSNFSDLLDHGAVTAASRTGVSVVSMSFGGGEFASETTFDHDMTMPNVTFVVSTGDAGAPPQYPSASPNVVAVGGTTLNIDGSNNYVSESAWSSAGAGVSAYEATPSYQTSLNLGGGKRVAPDVTFDADPNTGVAIYDSYTNASLPWAQIGGTSLAAPIFAGMMGIVNQGRASISLAPLDGVSGTLPMLYSAPASVYHDIINGSINNSQGSPIPTGTGFDLATGWGSPIANQMIPYLAQMSTVPTGITLTGGPNPVLVTRDADNVHADITVNGGAVQQLLLSQSTPFTFTGGSGDDTITFDFSQGDPLPAAGASIDGGTGANIVNVAGTGGNDTVSVGFSAATVTGGTAALPGGVFSNVPIAVNSVQSINFIGGSGGNDTMIFTTGVHLASATTPSGTPNITVKVQGNSTVNFSGDQRLAGLVLDGSTATLPAVPTTLTLAGTLQIINGGLLDIRQGQIYLDTTATAASVVRGYLANGYNHGLWNGTNSIISSAAAANPTVQSIGYATSGEGAVPPIPAGQMLVKYTTVGDADLSGTSDFGDFLTMQNNLNAAGDWSQGDFDYNGIVDHNDFSLLQPFL